jgi:hypothetical protein
MTDTSIRDEHSEGSKQACQEFTDGVSALATQIDPSYFRYMPASEMLIPSEPSDCFWSWLDRAPCTPLAYVDRPLHPVVEVFWERFGSVVAQLVADSFSYSEMFFVRWE